MTYPANEVKRTPVILGFRLRDLATSGVTCGGFHCSAAQLKVGAAVWKDTHGKGNRY